MLCTARRLLARCRPRREPADRRAPVAGTGSRRAGRARSSGGSRSLSREGAATVARLQELAQARDVDLHGVVDGRRRLLAPDLVDQAVTRDDLVRVEKEEREQRALPLPPSGSRCSPSPTSSGPRIRKSMRIALRSPTSTVTGLSAAFQRRKGSVQARVACSDHRDRPARTRSRPHCSQRPARPPTSVHRGARARRLDLRAARGGGPLPVDGRLGQRSDLGKWATQPRAGPTRT